MLSREALLARSRGGGGAHRNLPEEEEARKEERLIECGSLCLAAGTEVACLYASFFFLIDKVFQ